MGVLNMGLSILSVDPAWQQAFKGLVVIVAVAADFVTSHGGANSASTRGRFPLDVVGGGEAPARALRDGCWGGWGLRLGRVLAGWPPRVFGSLPGVSAVVCVYGLSGGNSGVWGVVCA